MTPVTGRLTLQREDGTALVLALVFLSLFGVFVTTILAFADTGVRTTLSLRDHDRRLYAVDGAMDGAVLYTRNDTERGRFGEDCPEFAMASTNDVSVVVECQPEVGSGAVLVGGGDNSGNKPQQAILTLSQAAGEDGIFVQNNTNPPVPLNITGSIRSNSTINVTAGTMAVEGDVRAAGACSGPITQTGVKNCSTGSAAPDPGAGDSRYDPRVSARPAEVSVPPCAGAGPIAMPTGTYTDAAALSTLMNSCDRTFIFQGVYYFDFDNVATVSCGDQSGPHLWCVSNGSAGFNLIGGTPDPATPGECLPSGPGVQFIFGGDSRVKFLAGKARICAYPETTRQRIAVYAKEGPAQPLPPLRTFLPVDVTLESASITSTGNPKFGTGPATNALVNATSIDDKVTSAEIAKSKDAFLNFDDYAPTIPSDATINTVKFKLRHREPPLARVDRLTVDITNGKGEEWPQIVAGAPPLCLHATMFCRADTLRTHEVLLVGPDFDEPSEVNGAEVRVTYFARTDNGADVVAAVDAAVFDVKYTPAPIQDPAPDPFPTQSGCVIATGTANIQSCSVITTDGSNTDVRINGTIYAPKSAVLIKSVNNGSQIIGRGLISRALRVELPGSAGLNESPIQIPADSDGAFANRKVIFTAKVNGVPRLRARVEYDDTAEPPAVSVRQWAVLR